MAKYWGLDPDIVKRWTMVDFSDRQEFMNLQTEISKPSIKNENPLLDGEEEWRGRKNG